MRESLQHFPPRAAMSFKRVPINPVSGIASLLAPGMPLLLALLAWPASARAQGSPGYSIRVSPGAEVRIALSGRPEERLTGRVAHASPDSIYVQLTRSATQTGFALAQLGSLEVRGGEDRRRGFARGAGIGGGLGLALSVVGGATDREVNRGELIGIGVENVLLVGAIGGAFGYIRAPAGWQKIPLPWQAHMLESRAIPTKNENR